jgi:hypothetical protein
LLAGLAAWFSALIAIRTANRNRADNASMNEMISLLRKEHESVAEMIREQELRMMLGERDIYDRRMRHLEGTIKALENKLAEKERRRK